MDRQVLELLAGFDAEHQTEDTHDQPAVQQGLPADHVAQKAGLVQIGQSGACFAAYVRRAAEVGASAAAAIPVEAASSASRQTAILACMAHREELSARRPDPVESPYSLENKFIIRIRWDPLILNIESRLTPSDELILAALKSNAGRFATPETATIARADRIANGTTVKQ